MNETKPAQTEGTSLPSAGHEEGQMRVRALIAGTNNQLGRALMTLLPQADFEPTGIDLPEVDISDAAAMSSWDQSGYDIVISTAAWTDVDGAEAPEGCRLFWRANTVGPVNLAQATVRRGLTLVHLSTKYIFDGATVLHTEGETPSPPGAYDQSKAAGDTAVSICPQYYLVRTSWAVGDGKDFVKAVLSLAERGITPSVVVGQTGRFTFASDLAAGIIHLLTVGAEFDTHSLSDDGPIVSWADVARRAYEHAGHSPDEVTAVTTEEYYAGQEEIAPRPLSSALDLAKIEATGLTPADSMEHPEAYLRGLL